MPSRARVDRATVAQSLPSSGSITAHRLRPIAAIAKAGYTRAMDVIRDWRTFPGNLRGGILSVGNFDGVHIGHAAMLEMARGEARRRGVKFIIMSFDPHPGTVLRPELPRPMISTLEQRMALLRSHGADALVLIEPTREFLGMSPDDFLGDVVARALGAVAMVEGSNFTFGKGALGDIAMVQRDGARWGIEFLLAPTRQVVLSDLTQVNVSSSLVRWLIAQGRVADAGKCLGRTYGLVGEVVRGEQRGRQIGFPTANVRSEQLLPAAGVYAGRCRLSDGRETFAAISVGTNPTFAGKNMTVEAFLLDFSGDLYGQPVELLFDRWIRDMWAFSGVEPLVRQIEKDVVAVRIAAATAPRPVMQLEV